MVTIGDIALTTRYGLSIRDRRSPEPIPFYVDCQEDGKVQSYRFNSIDQRLGELRKDSE